MVSVYEAYASTSVGTFIIQMGWVFSGAKLEKVFVGVLQSCQYLQV